MKPRFVRVDKIVLDISRPLTQNYPEIYAEATYIKIQRF